MAPPAFPSRFIPGPDGIARIAALKAGSYSDKAAHELATYFHDRYGHTVEVSNHATIAQVWDMQNVGSAILLPLQTSGSGLVKEHWRFVRSIHRDPTIRIVADNNLQVRMCLCGVPGSDPNAATTVMSHFQGIRQCTHLVGTSDIGKEMRSASVTERGALPHVVTHEGAASTAEALAEVARRGDSALMGLGMRESALELGLTVHDDDASNLPAARNFTQMLLLQRQHTRQSFHSELPYHGVLLTLRNSRGALRDLLAPIAESGTNITALHKRTMRPTEREREFFLELDTSTAHDVQGLSDSLDAVEHMKYPASWSSWSDRLQLAPDTPVERSGSVDWSALHARVTPDLFHYGMYLTPRNAPGVIHTLLDIIAKRGGDIVTFDSVTIGVKEFAYRISLMTDDEESMHEILRAFEDSGVVAEMSFTS